MGVGFGLGFFLVLFWLVLFLIPLCSLNGNSAESLVWPKPFPVAVVLYPSWKGKRACVCHPWGYKYSRNRFQAFRTLFFPLLLFFLYWSLSLNQYKHWDESHPTLLSVFHAQIPSGVSFSLHVVTIVLICGKNTQFMLRHLWKKFT